MISGVNSRLQGEGLKVTHGHWRPVAFSSEKSEGKQASAENPHGQAPRGAVSSVFKLGWLWLNWWLGWFRFLRKNSAAGVVLFDRYHADLLIDPRRYRYGGPIWLARMASRLMPQPDVVVFLDAKPEILLARKQEVSREALEKSRAAYLQLTASHPRFQIVDASQSLEDVVGEVLGVIDRFR